MPTFPKPTPRAIEKGQKRRKAEQALEQAYADVDLRDGGICRVTGAGRRRARWIDGCGGSITT